MLPGLSLVLGGAASSPSRRAGGHIAFPQQGGQAVVASLSPEVGKKVLLGVHKLL